MHIVAVILIGLVAGLLARAFHPGKDPAGIFLTILLGITGSFVAGFLGKAFGWYREPGQGPGLIMSTVGAILVLAVYTAIARRRHLHT